MNRDFCEHCKDGMFFDTITNSCKSCDENCLRCNEKRCLTCPVDNFLFEKERITFRKKKPDDLFNFISKMFDDLFETNLHEDDKKPKNIHIDTTCVKICPKEYNGKNVETNYIQRKCIVKLDEDAPTVYLPILNRSQNIQENLLRLKVKYNDEIEKIKKLSLELPNINYHKECYYNGKLKKEIRGNFNSYFICRCKENYTGDNCEISLSLYHNTQQKLMDILDQIEKKFIAHNAHQITYFLSDLFLVNKFKYGREISEKLYKLIKLYLHKEKIVLRRKKLYILLDSLLLNMYDNIEEWRKSNFVLYNSEIDIKEEEQRLFINMKRTVNLLEDALENHKYSGSFLELDQNKFIGFHTYSYGISEYKMKNYSFEGDEGFIVQNPNIDSASNLFSPTKVKVVFTDNGKKQLA